MTTDGQPLPPWLARLEAEIEREDAEDAVAAEVAPMPEIRTYECFASGGVVPRLAGDLSDTED
jgi:hypothetical protein